MSQARLDITARDKTKKAFKSAGRGIDDLVASIKSAQFSAGKLLGGGAIVAGLAGIGSAATSATLKWQGYSVALKAATGTQALARESMKFVEDEADRLGLALDALMPSFTQLAAAAKGTALEGEGAKRVFTSLSEAAAVMQLSTDNTQGAMLALTQILSKGKVQAEELRGQLGERIPGAFQIAARAMGVTTQQLDGMLSSGQVFSEEFLPKFAEQLKKEMAGGLHEATTSAQASFNRLKNAANKLMIAIGESGLVDFLADIADELTKLTKAIAFFMTEEKKATAEVFSFAEQLAEIPALIQAEQKELVRLKSMLEAAHSQDARQGLLDEIEERQLSVELYQEEIKLLEERIRLSKAGLSSFQSATGSLPKAPKAPEIQTKENLGDMFFPEITADLRNKRIEEDQKALDEYKKSLMSQTELEQLNYAERLEQLQTFNELKLMNDQQYSASKLSLEQQHFKRLLELAKTSDEALGALWAKGQREKLAVLKTVGEQILSAGATYSKKMFRLNKIAGIANATIATAQGIAEALKLTPPLSFVMAAKAAAIGYSQIRAIKASTFSGGGGSSSSISASAASSVAPTLSAPQADVGNDSSAKGALDAQNLNLTVVIRDGDRRERTLELLEDIEELRKEGKTVFGEA